MNDIAIIHRIGDAPPNTFPGYPSVPLTALDVLRMNNAEFIERWRRGLGRVQAAVAVLSSAIDRIGKRDVPVKAELVAQRDALAAALAAYEAVGREFEGPKFAPLLKRADALQREVAKARSDMLAAGPDTVNAKRAALDVAEARGRENWREVAAMLTAAAFPVVFPDVEAFERAESDMREVSNLWNRGQKARAVGRALELAAQLDRAPELAARRRASLLLESRLWGVYLSNAELQRWIDLRLAEGGQVAE